MRTGIQIADQVLTCRLRFSFPGGEAGQSFVRTLPRLSGLFQKRAKTLWVQWLAEGTGAAGAEEESTGAEGSEEDEE